MKKMTRPVCVFALRIAERAGVTEQIGEDEGGSDEQRDSWVG
jgi:hypothetical protein